MPIQTKQYNVKLCLLFQEMKTCVSVLCNTCCTIVKLLSFQLVGKVLHYLETLDCAEQFTNLNYDMK